MTPSGSEFRLMTPNHNLWIWSFWFVSTGDISKCVGAQHLEMVSVQMRQALKLKGRRKDNLIKDHAILRIDKWMLIEKKPLVF